MVAAMSGRQPPLPGAAVIVEASARSSETAMDELSELSAALDSYDAVVADGPAGRDLWAWRDRHTESIARVGIPAKCDVAVPLTQWAAFHDAIPAALAAVDPELYAVRFGHVADGNLHVNVLRHDGQAPSEDADAAIWALASSCGGTVSATIGPDWGYLPQS